MSLETLCDLPAESTWPHRLLPCPPLCPFLQPHKISCSSIVASFLPTQGLVPVISFACIILFDDHVVHFLTSSLSFLKCHYFREVFPGYHILNCNSNQYPLCIFLFLSLHLPHSNILYILLILILLIVNLVS